MATMRVGLVTPEREVWAGEATFVQARSVEGELGILPHHIPLLAELAPGVVRIRPEGGDEVVAAVGGGFLSVSADGVSVLAEEAVLASDVNVAEARQELDQARGADPESDPDAPRRARSAEAQLRAAGETP